MYRKIRSDFFLCVINVWRCLVLFAAIVLSGSVQSGCNENSVEPSHFDVSGVVEYNGAPLKRGRIAFVPDNTKGNKGRTGYAEIHDGSYSTATEGGRGVVEGALKVTIEGYQEETSSGSSVVVERPLFDVFKTTVVIDGNKDNKSVNFSVPMSRKKMRRR